MADDAHQTSAPEARAKLAEIRARIDAMPKSTVPPEALTSDPRLTGCADGGACAFMERHDAEIARLRAVLRGVVVMTAGLAWAREVHDLAKAELNNGR